MCQYAEHLYQYADLTFSQKDISFFRRRLKEEIINGRLIYKAQVVRKPAPLEPPSKKWKVSLDKDDDLVLLNVEQRPAQRPILAPVRRPAVRLSLNSQGALILPPAAPPVVLPTAEAAAAPVLPPAVPPVLIRPAKTEPAPQESMFTTG